MSEWGRPLREPRHGNAMPAWQEQRVLQLVSEGLEYQLIAERVGIHERTVWRVLVRNGRPVGPGGKRLGEAKVREIRRRRREGESIRHIAHQVGCEEKTVSKYLYVARGMELARRRSR